MLTCLCVLRSVLCVNVCDARVRVCVSRSVPSVRVRLVSSLPPGAGLGSSAAYSACLAASLLRYRHLVSEPSTAAGANPNIGGWAAADLTLINSWAFQSEKIIHGTPSGIDNSISTYGG